MKKLSDYIDIQTFIIAISLSLTWILSTDYLVDRFLPQAWITSAQSFKGLFFVFILSLILALIHAREKKHLKHKSEEFNLLFKNSPIPTMIFCVKTKKVIEVNQSAANLFKYTIDQIKNFKIDELLINSENWNSIFEDLSVSQNGKTHISLEGKDRYRKSFSVYATLNSSKLLNRQCVVIYLENM